MTKTKLILRKFQDIFWYWAKIYVSFFILVGINSVIWSLKHDIRKIIVYFVEYFLYK